MADRYYDDVAAGETFAAGPARVTQEDIVAFAERYDPRPMHLDRDATGGAASDGVVASGWHTAAVAMRLFVDAVLSDCAVVAAAGIEDLRWLEPVRPGDELRLTATVTDREPWDGSKGLVTFEVDVRNQDAVSVMTVTERVLLERTGG